jgi:ribonuclease P protein component
MHKPSNVRPLFSFSSQERRKLLFKARTIFKNAGLEIRVLPRKSNFSRLLVITPKKMGSAPTRNLMRRRLKAIFYEDRLSAKPFDAVVYCTRESAVLSFSELKQILYTTLTSAPTV